MSTASLASPQVQSPKQGTLENSLYSKLGGLSLKSSRLLVLPCQIHCWSLGLIFFLVPRGCCPCVLGLTPYLTLCLGLPVKCPVPLGGFSSCC